MWVISQVLYEYNKHSALFFLAYTRSNWLSDASTGRIMICICCKNLPVIGIVFSSEATLSKGGRFIILHLDPRRLQKFIKLPDYRQILYEWEVLSLCSQ